MLTVGECVWECVFVRVTSSLNIEKVIRGPASVTSRFCWKVIEGPASVKSRFCWSVFISWEAPQTVFYLPRGVFPWGEAIFISLDSDLPPSTAIGSGPLRAERRRCEARHEIVKTPRLVTARQFIIGPQAEGRPGPSSSNLLMKSDLSDIWSWYKF